MMKYTVVLVLTTILAVRMTQQMDRQNIEDAMHGFVRGMLLELGYSDLVECVQDVQYETDYIVQGIESILKNTEVDINKGLKQIEYALQKLQPETNEECGWVINDIQKLYVGLSKLDSPQKFVQHIEQVLEANGTDIRTDIHWAQSYYRSGDYRNLGQQVALICYELLLDQSMGNQDNIVDIQQQIDRVTGLEIGLVFKEVVETFFVQKYFGQLLPCIQDFETEADLVYQSVLGFVRKDSKSVRKAFKELGQALDSLPKAMQDCRLPTTEIQKIQNVIKQFKSPVSFVHHIGQDLVINGVRIFEDVEQTVSDYKVKQYQQMGRTIGHAMSKLQLITKDTTLVNRSNKFLG